MVCCVPPQWLQFKSKVSIVLWAEFNLLFLAIWARGTLDLSSLVTIVAFTSLAIIKLRQYVDGISVDPEQPTEYLSPQGCQKCTECTVACINKSIHKLASMNTPEEYIKFFAKVLFASWVLKTFCWCTLTWLGTLLLILPIAGNAVFGASFLQYQMGINVCQLSEGYVHEAKAKASTLKIPKYKESKKNI